MESIPGFKGYFMHDELPTLGEGESLIINLDDSYGAGTHWTCAFSCYNPDIQDYENYYFDSFGLPPSDEIIERLEIDAYSNSQFQRVESMSCGLFCLYVLHYCVTENIPFEEVTGSGDYLIPYGTLANEAELIELIEP